MKNNTKALLVRCDEIRGNINRLPRVRLAHVPTPLEECPRLSEMLGGPRIFIKRDDCTGLAFGGNKARQLEFTLGEALSQGADTVVIGAASQSNHCRQAAAAAARLGLECTLCLQRDSKSVVLQGNYLIDRLLSADVRLVDAEMGAQMEEVVKEVAEKLRNQGRRSYPIVPPRSEVLGAVAYVEALVELWEQLIKIDLVMDKLYVCSAGPTGAGLLLAQQILVVDSDVIAIAPMRSRLPAQEKMVTIADMVSKELGFQIDVTSDRIVCYEDYVGPGFGAVTEESRAAVELMAEKEGILLEPVWSGKALAALIDHIQRRQLTSAQTVVFLHTGGTPTLFAYVNELMGEQE